MSRDFAVQASSLVARSMKVGRATHMTVAAVVGAIALNASIAIQFLGALGQAVLLAVIFASVAAGITAISADIYSRSSQAVKSLKSIGASSRAISYALIMSVIGYGAAGAVLGAAAGTGVGAAIGSAGASSTALLVGSFGVVLAASAATAAGVYAGARIWHN
jgi:hypothetical protein